MKLKETLAAGVIGLSTLTGCGDDPELKCGTGIQDISISQADKIRTVWDYCAATEQVGMLDNENSYVICPATCTDSPKRCERKYTCRQVWEQKDENGGHLDIQNMNGCTGNSAAECTEKVRD